jgi:GR25 family glycosyltransferase involved in LPS biosynthesis
VIVEPLPYTPGALGAALTHIEIWRSCTAPMTVCEDDALLHRRFEPEAERLLAALPVGWDIVLWGWNFDSDLVFDMLPGISPCIGRFDPNIGHDAATGFRDQPVKPQLFRLWRAWGCMAYTVSPAGAAKLRQASTPLKPQVIAFPELGRSMMNTGGDVVMSRAYPLLDAYVCFPPLAITRNDRSESTIQTGSGWSPPAGSTAAP